MRRLLRWIVGLFSALAVWRLVSRRRAREMPAPTLEADPADELRRKLAEARHSTEPEVEAERDTAAETLEERRARVHAKAQEAIDTMHVEEP